MNAPTINTEIDWNQPILETTELAAARAELHRQDEASTTCKWCRLSIRYDSSAHRFVAHVEDKTDTCVDGQYVVPANEELTEDQRETMQALDKVAMQLDGDLTVAQQLMNDENIDDVIQGAVEDEVPEFIQPYVNWRGYIDSVFHDSYREAVRVMVGSIEYVYHLPK